MDFLKSERETMKKFLKVISMLLVFATLATVMVGCGKKVDEDGVPTLVWYMRKPTGDMSHQAQVEEAANAIIEPAIGAKVHFEFVDAGAWDQKKSVLINSGEEFDLILEMGETFVTNAEKGAFLDLREYLNDEYIPEIMSRVGDFAWDAVTFRDGGVYAIPSETFYVPYSGFCFKADIADKYNFDVKSADSYDDLEPLFKAVKENEPGMYGTLRLTELPSTEYIPSTIEPVLFDVANDKFIAIVDSPDKIEYWKAASKYYQAGYIPADAASKTETASEIKSGRYASMHAQLSEEKSSNYWGFKCYEGPIQFGRINRTNVTNCVTAISRTSKNPEKALALLDLIWKDRELSNLLAFGIEGLDYEVTANPGTDDRFIQANTGNDVKWAIWHNWLGPLWDQYDSSWNRVESLMFRKEKNETAEISPVIGFLPDLSDYKTETAMCASIVTETKVILETGSMPDYDKYYAEMKARFEEAGLYDIVDEFNKQYEEWKNK